MAFKMAYTSDGSVPGMLKMAAGDATYTVGTALYLVSGLLEIAVGAVKATHICMENKTIATTGTLLCYEITPAMVFEVPIEDVDADYHAVGKIAQLFTDGAQITDAAAGVVYAAGTSGGDGAAGVDGPTTATPSHTGALIVDMLSAAVDGDVCLVKLSH